MFTSWPPTARPWKEVVLLWHADACLGKTSQSPPPYRLLKDPFNFGRTHRTFQSSSIKGVHQRNTALDILPDVPSTGNFACFRSYLEFMRFGGAGVILVTNSDVFLCALSSFTNKRTTTSRQAGPEELHKFGLAVSCCFLFHKTVSLFSCQFLRT